MPCRYRCRRQRFCGCWRIVARVIAHTNDKLQLPTVNALAAHRCNTILQIVIPLCVGVIFTVLVVWCCANDSCLAQSWIFFLELVYLYRRCKYIDIVWVSVCSIVYRIVIVLYLNVWVIAIRIWIDFLVYGFRIDRRHKCCARKRMLDKAHTLATYDTVIDRVGIGRIWIIVNSVIPRLITSPNDLWIAIRNISVTTITNDTCNDFIVSWCTRIILQSNTFTELENERRRCLMALCINGVYFLRREAECDKETLTLCISSLAFIY